MKRRESLFYKSIRLVTVMQDDEFTATAALQSIGCWTEFDDGHATSVSFDECDKVEYHNLRHLAHLPYLRDICFFNTPVDGPVLLSLTCNHSLSSLNLNCTSVSQSDIKLIAGFPNLEMLGLKATTANDECLDSMLACRKITNLRIDDTEISPRGTTRLAESLDLDTLWIGGPQLSTESLLAISRLPHLCEFNVCGETVDDSHIDILLTFPDPENLLVRNTRISTQGLGRLEDIDPWASGVD